ncbi:MAG: class I SAM-dependent methyltransferase [Candidatus Pristimantibacillus lignocellulolyticus]|uniref:Class I SAM-dependent methyltransferase n=1 Tax=Candidatus Pristimantibacillus lignocellulolyticus TaxID=2994561 RepID=A0A9J6ZCC3_9BACL|nr:MAG: class I SAM-dependent methyltransferase [Candidatus Pristimantibacillus lignocellulolyticus]
MEITNQYNNIGYLYDLDQRDIVKDDLSFYIDYAHQYGQEILEVACGTGRISIPLAREGFNVTGIDLSDHMIKVLEHKLLNESMDTRSRVNPFVADMTEFISNKKFSLIIIPFRSFQLLTEESQITRFLKNVRTQLTEDGVFILTAYRPYGLLDETWVQDEHEDWVIYDQNTNKKVTRTQIRKSIDTDKQITYPEHIYYIEEPDGTTQKHTQKLAMKYYYEEQLRNLLVTSGFNIREEFGYYDLRPIEEGPELIFVCNLRIS